MRVTTRLTADDLFQMGDIGPAELVKGELVRRPFADVQHGIIAANVGAILFDFVERRKLGVVLGGGIGIVIAGDPDTVRAANAAYLSNERMAQIEDLSKFLNFAPDLVVEVVSPTDRWSEVEEKVAEYLSIGVRLVWVINLKTRSIHVYRPSSEVRRILEGDTLDGEDVLPGFAVAVRELFE